MKKYSYYPEEMGAVPFSVYDAEDVEAALTERDKRIAELEAYFTDDCNALACPICHVKSKRIADLTAEAAKAKKDSEYLLSIVKLAYRKHHLNDDSIGWSEFDDNLLDALCNIMGEDGYDKWIKAVTQERGKR